MERLYIFFDIDGVLNGARDWDAKIFPINAECMKYFAETVNFFREKYEVHLILSSSWRSGYEPEEGHSAEIVELIKKLSEFDMAIEDKTPFFIDRDRADEVNDYVIKHDLKNCRCIAIDDTRELFEEGLLPNVQLHIVRSRNGFGRSDFEILTGSKVGWLFRLLRFFGLKT